MWEFHDALQHILWEVLGTMISVGALDPFEYALWGKSLR